MLSLKEKQLLFNGYMSADGHGLNSVGTSDLRLVEFIEDLSALYGCHIHSKTYFTHNTNFKDNAEMYVFHFTTSHSKNTPWTVKGIIRDKHFINPVWCIEEPITHSFTLEGGIVTGNCLSIPLDKLLANGFKTRQTDVRPAGSVNTAMQLVAVIMQLQSLQQFGGVSATHLD